MNTGRCHFVCQHPAADRHPYPAYDLEFCTECCSYHHGGGNWPAVSRWIYADRSLRAKAGYVLYPDWYETRRLWAATMRTSPSALPS